MLQFIVILLAIVYLVMHFTGWFDQIAGFLNQMEDRYSGQNNRRTAQGNDQPERLQVFEEFFGKNNGEDDKGEES